MKIYYAIGNCYNYKYLNHRRRFSNLDPLQSTLFSNKKYAEAFLKHPQFVGRELRVVKVCMTVQWSQTLPRLF